MRKSVNGFTIVELLIVIVVIAILAAISIVAYTGIQQRARATTIASDITAIEKALNAYKVTAGASSWWRENDATLLAGGTASISSIVTNNTEFRDFLRSAPTTEGLITTSGQWYYDNDGDTYNGCSVSSTGVNIYTPATNSDLAQAIDNAIDDGNLSCGKVRLYTNNNLFFSLARTET